MSKAFLKVRRIEELPSFLLTTAPEGAKSNSKPSSSDFYLGPIFFGESKQNQPPLHSVKFETLHQIGGVFEYGEENIADLFRRESKPQVKKRIFNESRKIAFKRAVKRPLPQPAKHYGTRRDFVNVVMPPVLDLGKSTSIVEGEIVLEVPLYRLKTASSGGLETKFELFKFSEIKEKRRNDLPYNERIAHIHYPKQFATVTVVGPTIPASIKITKIPSKRKTQSVTSLVKARKVGKIVEDVEEKKQLRTEKVMQQTGLKARVDKSSETNRNNDSEKNSVQGSEKESEHRELSDERNLEVKTDDETQKEERNVTPEDTEKEEETGETAETNEKVEGNKGEPEENAD